LSLRVALTRGRLDRQISEGYPCEATEALSLRARQLTHAENRRRLASELRSVVDYVDQVGSRRDRSAVVIEQVAVRDGREALLGLAERLEGASPVSPRGLVLTKQLLTDGVGSPLFNLCSDASAVDAVWKVADVLGADAPTIGIDGLRR
jgi:hypothetical protein